MTQPVQQQRFTEPHLHNTTSTDEIIQGELVALYHRSDALLRELTIVRRRMDELHAAIQKEPITVDSLRQTIEARKADAEVEQSNPARLSLLASPPPSLRPVREARCNEALE